MALLRRLEGNRVEVWGGIGNGRRLHTYEGPGAYVRAWAHKERLNRKALDRLSVREGQI